MGCPPPPKKSTFADGVLQQALPPQALAGVGAEEGARGQGGRGLLAAPRQRQHVGEQPHLLLQQRRDLTVVLQDAVCGEKGEGVRGGHGDGDGEMGTPGHGDKDMGT